MTLQILKHHKLENKNHHFWHNGKQHHNFILDALPQHCKERTYKVGTKHPIFIPCAFPSHLMKNFPGCPKGRAFLKGSATCKKLNY